MCHVFFVYFAVDEHLGCFYVIAIANSAMNTCIFLNYGFLLGQQGDQTSQT